VTCPLSIQCVPSHPLAGSVKVIQQAARLLGLLTNSAPMLDGALYTSSLLQEASPARQGYADLERRGTRRLLRQHTLEDPSTIFFMSLGPHVGAQYFVHAPLFSYKRGGIRRYRVEALRPSFTQTLTSSYKLPSNTSHSGVGCYAPAARTTLNTCVFLCSTYFPTNKQNS
jgi:hypothetical protein